VDEIIVRPTHKRAAEKWSSGFATENAGPIRTRVTCRRPITRDDDSTGGDLKHRARSRGSCNYSESPIRRLYLFGAAARPGKTLRALSTASGARLSAHFAPGGCSFPTIPGPPTYEDVPALTAGLLVRNTISVYASTAGPLRDRSPAAGGAKRLQRSEPGHSRKKRSSDQSGAWAIYNDAVPKPGRHAEPGRREGSQPPQGPSLRFAEQFRHRAARTCVVDLRTSHWFHTEYRKARPGHTQAYLSRVDGNIFPCAPERKVNRGTTA